MSEILVNTIKKADGTGGFTVPAETGTVLTSASSITQNSGPAVYVYGGPSQSVSDNTWTKVLYSTEGFDTDGCWASSRFTPNVEGYYQINAVIQVQNFAPGDSYLTTGLSMDGGSTIIRTLSRDVKRSGAYNHTSGGSTLVYMNGTTDYVELFVIMSTGTTETLHSTQENMHFTAYLARAA